jgi:glutamate/aspartate transport system substrate-binding protein
MESTRPAATPVAKRMGRSALETKKAPALLGVLVEALTSTRLGARGQPQHGYPSPEEAAAFGQCRVDAFLGRVLQAVRIHASILANFLEGGPSMHVTRTIAALIASSLIAAPVLGQELTGTLKKVKDSGKITMGIRESSFPLSYLDDKQQPIGYHIDVCNRIVDEVKAQLKMPGLKVEHQAVTSQNRIPLVQNGTVDLECGSTTNNEGRQKQVSFVDTTYVTNVRMAVKKASGITSLSQLGGKPVATTTGTTSVQLMRAHEKGKNIDFKELYGKDHADSFLLLETDRAVAFVMDDNLLAGLIASAKKPSDYAIVGEVLNVEPIAIMVRKDDAPFKKLADDTVKNLIKSGEIEQLYNKWFMSPIPPKGVNMNFPMSEKLKEALKNPNDAPAEAYNRK